MRIHGIHLQGIRAPQGEHRIALDPGYTAVQAAEADEALALLRLVDALLHPNEAFVGFANWAVPRPGANPRAGLSFSQDGHVYQLLADFEERRVVLASYEASTKSYTRISNDALAIRDYLARAGLPTRAEFLALCVRDTGSLSSPPAPAPTRAPPAAPRARPRAELEARAQQLRQALRQLEQLEAEEKELASELGTRASAGDLEDLESRVEAYRDRATRRAEEIALVEAERRILLDERSELSTVPAARSSGTWLGLALGAAGAAAGTLVHPGFYLAGAVGIGGALVGLSLGRNARRRVGAVEARLAGLRVREATIERRFESDTQPLRQLLHTLGVESVEGLADAGERYRELGARHDALRTQLEQARQDCPADALAELGAIEEQLARPEPAPAPPTPLPAAPSTPAPSGAPDPEERVRAAERLAGSQDAELRARLIAVLPIYLRALTGGRYTRAWFDASSGWSLRCEESRERTPWASAFAEAGAPLDAAFQLALLEALAAAEQPWLLVGPEPFAAGEKPGPEQGEVLARALKRLAGALQVIQFASGPGPWLDHAAAVQRLDGPR